MAETKINRKIPTKLYVFNSLMYFIGIVFTIIYSGLTCMTGTDHEAIPFSFARLMSMAFSWQTIIVWVVMIAILVASQKIILSKIAAYDGSEKSCDECNKVQSLMGNINIVVAVGGAVVIPLVMGKAGVSKGYPFPVTSFVMVNVSATLLLAIFMYILWIEAFEQWMSFLPFRKKDMTFGLVTRDSLVAALTSIAAVAGIAGPLMYFGDNNHGNFMDVLLQRLWPMVVLVIGMSIVDFRFLFKGFINRLGKILDFGKNLAEKDYSKPDMPVESRDEFGLLINDLNESYRTTREVLKSVRATVDESNTLADDLHLNMGEASTSVQQIVGNISTIRDEMTNQSAGVEEANAATKEILSNIRHLNESIENQVANVEESSAAVRQMVANIQSVTEILSKNESSMNELQSASEEGHARVDEAVKLSDKVLEESSGLQEASNVIQSIASQTNLLAMNAAIEAAHAGESGKGFAVVADEIRKLAEQSNKQGKQIASSLQGLDEVIKGVSESTKHVQLQFAKILEMTNIVKDQEDVVMNAMKEQSEGSAQVLEAMRNIDDSTNSVKQNSQEMLASGTQVAQEMDALGKTSLHVSSSVNEVASGTDRILSAVEKVSSGTEKNKQNLGSVLNEINGFTL